MRVIACNDLDLNAGEQDNEVDAPIVCHTMNVNRGGQCGIEVEPANRSISLSLWPQILHRASSIKYFDGFGMEVLPESPYDESPRAAVVFSLLKEYPCIFESIGKTDEEHCSQPVSKKAKAGVNCSSHISYPVIKFQFAHLARESAISTGWKDPKTKKIEFKRQGMKQPTRVGCQIFRKIF